MKLWKGATFAFVLCGAALSILLVKNTATVGQNSPPPSGPHRRIRSTNEMNSLLSEFSSMFQSFTEGELQHVVETLLDRKRRKSLGDNQARRTKRARRPKSCSLRQLELTVTELGFGYESDETVVLRYCSGKCTAHRKNYDLAMKHMMQTGFRLKGRRDKVSNGPCCRPTAFEKNISFLDNKNRYQTLQNVSATNCGCV
uniref:Neurturin n=1 Tax=Gasterosteus aculeatus TaxID=69293 RepID=G3PX72_GASAC